MGIAREATGVVRTVQGSAPQHNGWLLKDMGGRGLTFTDMSSCTARYTGLVWRDLRLGEGTEPVSRTLKRWHSPPPPFLFKMSHIQREGQATHTIAYMHAMWATQSNPSLTWVWLDYMSVFSSTGQGKRFIKVSLSVPWLMTGPKCRWLKCGARDGVFFFLCEGTLQFERICLYPLLTTTRYNVPRLI